MDYLWSPWRYQYVTQGAQAPEGGDPCLFCRVAAQTDDRANYVVLRAKRNFVMLNRFPYTTGHLLIAPYEHVATLEEANPETMEELIRLAQRCEAALRKIYHAGGFNFRIQHRPSRRRRDRRPHPYACDAALAWRHELRNDGRRNARAAGGAGDDIREGRRGAEGTVARFQKLRNFRLPVFRLWKRA